MDTPLYFVNRLRSQAHTAASYFCEENKGTFIAYTEPFISASHLTERERIEYNLCLDDTLSAFLVCDYVIGGDAVAYFCYVEYDEV